MLTVNSVDVAVLSVQQQASRTARAIRNAYKCRALAAGSSHGCRSHANVVLVSSLCGMNSSPRLWSRNSGTDAVRDHIVALPGVARECCSLSRIAKVSLCDIPANHGAAIQLDKVGDGHDSSGGNHGGVVANGTAGQLRYR